MFKRKTIYNKAARRRQLNLKTYWTLTLNGLIEQEYFIYCESDKSSDQYLSTLEDVTEGRTEELSCETWSL
jgi:hypothetical protein